MKPLFTFVHVTDTHWREGSASDGMLRRFVETINSEALCDLPDYVIHTGDIISGYNDSIAAHYRQMRGAKAVLDGLAAPACCLCHNHDTYGEEVRGRVFDEVFGAPHLQEIERDGFYLLLLCGSLASSTLFGETPPGAEPPPWGFDLHTDRGKALLRSRLGGRPGSRKLLLSHAGLVTPRHPPAPQNPSLPLPPRTGFGYCLQEERAASVRQVLSETGVFAHYCGHSHVNSRVAADGIEFISTGSLCHYPGEARHVAVFEDRIVNRMLPIPGGEDLPIRWPNTTDVEHATERAYMAGVDREREFTLDLR